MGQIPSQSVDLIVTSPPYPMIEMWDAPFILQDQRIEKHLCEHDGQSAFERMHTLLDSVWKECFRVLKPGGFACINIGDATRTLGSEFQIYSNHSRILTAMVNSGFSALPLIIWRKQTNAPNKFMGSGMLPAGAYVTLEHEYILIFRKGGKRLFETQAQKQLRRESAIFWEERNQFFSDIWLDIKGRPQKQADSASRQRSAAFPFELAYRLINMYSVKQDTVLDPFMGTGTTHFAAMVSNRNSVGIEIDPSFESVFKTVEPGLVEAGNDIISQRIENHVTFIEKRKKDGLALKHRNLPYNFEVVTSQEKELFFNPLKSCSLKDPNHLEVTYDQPTA